jgi:DNA replication protein DnaC
MLIDFICETHGTNKLKLSRNEQAFYDARKDIPHSLEYWIKNDLKCPVCSKEKEIELFKKTSYIPLRFQSCSFENFSETRQKEIVLDYVKNFQDKQKQGTSLVFCGTTGSGKTHLASALCFYLIENYQIKVLYTKAFDVLREVKETYNKNSKKTFSDVQDKHAKVDLLIIDEVGVQFGTETEKQILFEIINERYENIRPTILVTNLSLTNLKEFVGDRVIDRMKENGGKIIVFSGESFRGKK